MMPFQAKQIEPILLVKDIADRLRNSDKVKALVSHQDNHNPLPVDPAFSGDMWFDLPLAVGYPSLLLLFSELASQFPNENWETASHHTVLKIAGCLQGQNISQFSLYTGLAGVCYAIQKASGNGKHYRKLLDNLNNHLIQAIETHYLAPIRNNLNQGKPSPSRLYDLIQGITGIGIYLLENPSNPLFPETLERVLENLIKLSMPLKVDGKEVPGWYLPPELQVKSKQQDSKGHCDIGLAHGISGVLGFLSLCSIRGIEIHGQKEAMQRIIQWLQQQRRDSKEGYFWKTIQQEEDIQKKDAREQFTGRDAWCYGTPGVAASLLLASKAMHDDALKTYAHASLLSVFNRSREQWFLPGPTMCHGISGLLLITQAAAKENACPVLTQKAEMLLDILLEYFNPEFPFGFKEYEPCSNGSFFQCDCSGLLNGASGVLLTLLSYKNKTDSRWHLPFLIHHE